MSDGSEIGEEPGGGPGLRTHEDGSVTVPLTEPVLAHGEPVHELTIRRPKTRDLRATDGHKGEVAKSIALISRLAAVPPSAIDELELADFNRCAEVVDGFLGEEEPGSES